MLTELLNALQVSMLGDAVRSLGGWGYAVINFFHLLGAAILFGAILLLDLRLLGWRRHIPLDFVSSFSVPLAISGFLLAIVMGICLLVTNASDYVGNPFLVIKFSALLLALVNACWASQLPAWKYRKHQQALELERQDKLLVIAAFLSLLCWLTVIAAGRFIAYW